MIQRFRTLAWMMLIVVTASLLYGVKYKVQSIKEEAVGVSEQINHEKDTLRVLTAEWTYLNRPERIEKLAYKYLNLTPLQGEQIADIEVLRDVPLKEDAMAVTPASASTNSLTPLMGFLAKKDERSHAR